MIEIDGKLEKLFQFYKEIGLFMPVIVNDYVNGMAFRIRMAYIEQLKRRIIKRSGKINFITSGRIINVTKAFRTRNIDRIQASVGARISPNARDPQFMRRIEFGGRVLKDRRYGGIGVPSTEGARGGNLSSSIPKRLSMPRLAAQSLDLDRSDKFKSKQKIAVATRMAVDYKLPFIRVKGRSGKVSIYRVKGGSRRKGSSGRPQLIRMWTISDKEIVTRPLAPLKHGIKKAAAHKERLFKQAASRQFKRFPKSI